MTEGMRILHVIASVNPEEGGVVEAVRQICLNMGKLGHLSEVVCNDAPDAAWLPDAGLPVVHALGPAGGFGYNPAWGPWLNENVRRFDAVILHGLWKYPFIAVRRAMRESRTPYFVFPHGMLDPWFKKTYPLKHLKKWIYWLLAERMILRDAHAVIFTCDEERRLARRTFWPYKVNEVVAALGIAEPPIDHGDVKEAFLSCYPMLRGKRILLFLGRIHEKKGCDLLLQAFARLAHEDEALHLVMAGPDQTGWAKVLQQEAERLGVAARVTWPGMLLGPRKWGAYHAAEAFCLPSHQENFGIVVAEALACGKPVLLSNKVNIWREVVASGAGLVAEDDLEGTVQSLAEWLSMTDEARARMSSSAYACFMENFHIEQTTRKLAGIVCAGGAT